jgi:hypothetical protein
MTIAMQPIYTQTVGSGGATSITFNSIPQTFTDLKLVMSSRTAGANNFFDPSLQFNNDASSVYSYTQLYGTGSGSATSDRASNFAKFPLWQNGSSSTSNTFGNYECYIPNYTSSNFKQVIIDAVTENNASTALSMLVAGLWRSTSAISTMNISSSSNAFQQYTTFSLYGITKG